MPDTLGLIPPRLVAIEGPLAGEVLALREPETTIGRDVSNSISLADISLSRLHCAITASSNGWRIRDLQSSNGTFVNGAAITEQALEQGDRIALGGSVFLFVTRPGDLSSPDETIVLPLADTAYLQGNQNAGTAQVNRTERGLRALLAISTAINAVRSEADLFQHLTDLLRQAVAADYLAVIVVGADGEPAAVQQHRMARARGVDVSHTLVKQALQRRAALLRRLRDLPDAPSLVAAGVRSAICVPLAVRDRVIGALYLATTHDADPFDEDDLQLLTAIANVTSIAIDNVRHMASLESEAERLRGDLALTHDLVGSGACMRRIYEVVARVAASDATVLVTGETGTGKELVARAIHQNSPRAKRPFIAINCAALTETLLESELFGHERGAFTGALAQKKGKLEVADGGTVFLDEIGELAPNLQSKLLRVLQFRQIERVGGTRSISIDVRVISATNRNLAEGIETRQFRSDLYHRLNVVQIDVPPLRERREDIPSLANHFLTRFARKSSRPVRAIAAAAMKCLVAYEWPGNVRELENSIERAVVLGVGDEILPEDLPEALLEAAPVRSPELPQFHDVVRDAKARAIAAAFREAGGSYTEAARRLGLHPNYLHRLIRNMDLKSVLQGNAVCRSERE